MHRKTKSLSLWRMVQKLSATFFCFGLGFVSCKKNANNIGENLTSNSLDVSFVDTFTLVTYSEELDSVQSDETAVGLLGAYIDPEFGKVDCGLVMQIEPSSLSPDLGTTFSTVVDSIVLSLKFTSLLYYGAPAAMTFEVYEITDDLVRDDQDYYAFEAPNHTGTNIVLTGSETITPDFYSLVVVGDDTVSAHLRIPLLTSVGDEFVVDSEAGLLASTATFIDNFKGIYVKVASSSLAVGEGAVLYFSPEDILSEVTMYFHDGATAGEFSFLINANTARYNSISFDRTGTDIEAALADPDMGMSEFYAQASSVRAIVELPYIANFNYDAAGNYNPKIINKAELVLPVQDYVPDPYNPSGYLFLARIVDANSSSFTVDYNFGSSFDGSNAVSYDDDAREYRFIFTRELQRLLTGDGENLGYRIYPPSFFSSSIERVIFNGPNTLLKEKPRLEVTYTDY